VTVVDRPIRMLVVGAGRGLHHLRSFQELRNSFAVAGLVDLDEERLRKGLEEHNLTEAFGFTSFQDALASSGCDGVMVATWARGHHDLIDQALEAGKHVMVEKPFTLELDDAMRLLEKASQKGLKIVVTQQWRYLPGQRTVRRLLAASEYGTVLAGHLVSYKARGGEYPDSKHSQLWQMTIHEIDSLIAMMSQPIVEVYGHSFQPPATTWQRESTVTAELTFQNGCRIVLLSTSEARAHSCEFRVECEHAALIYRNSAVFGSDESLLLGRDSAFTLTTGDLPSTFETLSIDVGLSDMASLDKKVAEGFATWVQGGPEPETSGRRNLQVLGVLDALLRSGATGEAAVVRS
jgi:predicted dehydrogenase